MRKVKRTKNPTLAQAKNMSINLGEKFGKYASVDISFHCHVGMNVEVAVTIYVQDNGGKNRFGIDWETAQNTYFKLMEEKND